MTIAPDGADSGSQIARLQPFLTPAHQTTGDESRYRASPAAYNQFGIGEYFEVNSQTDRLPDVEVRADHPGWLKSTPW